MQTPFHPVLSRNATLAYFFFFFFGTEQSLMVSPWLITFRSCMFSWNSDLQVNLDMRPERVGIEQGTVIPPGFVIKLI